MASMATMRRRPGQAAIAAIASGQSSTNASIPAAKARRRVSRP